MGVRVTGRYQAVLYDSVTGVAFGPVFEEPYGAADFIEWWEAKDHKEYDDLRKYPDQEIMELYNEWQDS